MARYDGPITDSDIHHVWRYDSDLLEYLPERWREYALLATPNGAPDKDAPSGVGYSGSLPMYAPGVTVARSGSHGSRMANTFPEGGGKAGSSYELLSEHLLDEYDYYRAVITFESPPSAVENPYWGAAICRAINDWNADKWLSSDERLYATMVGPWTIPDEAVKEIRRIGTHPKVLAIGFEGNPFGHPIGHPVYHSLYETAHELGLAVFLHPGPDRPTPAISAGGGTLTDGPSWVAALSQQGMHHVTSLIVHGVFEKFPGLKFVINEFGVAWLPALMWKMDAHYELLKVESPWVKKLPSEYIRESIRLSTQPLEESPKPQGLIDLLGSVDGMEDILCFATDYPHFSYDEPMSIANRLPTEWQRKVMCDNLCDFVGWERPAAEARAPAAARP